MAKIERKAQKIFGGNLSPSGNIAIYGSKEAGSPSYSDNLDTIQSQSWLQGILGATSPAKAPYVQDLNAIFYTITKQLAYLFQAGIAEWNSATEYYAGESVVRYGGQIYIAIANNTNQAPTNTSYWMRYNNSEFNQTYANLIGGYSVDSVLYFIDNAGMTRKIKSLINNNTNAPTEANIKLSANETGTFYWRLSDNNVAPGTIIPFAGTKAPFGWGFCIGTEVSRTTYALLFRQIGTAFGAGDGSTTFNLPDYRDKTFWGGDTSNVGTVKNAGLPNITGTLYSVYTDRRPNEGGEAATGAFGTYGSENKNRDGGGSASDAEYGINFNASRSSSIYGNSTTVQPPAIQTPFIIKY